MNLPEKYSQIIKTQAKNLGFDFCGIAKAEFLDSEAPRLEEWLNRNYQGKMAYLANHFDKRLDPTKLVEGAKTVVSLIYNYYPEKQLPHQTDDIKLAKYAYGADYHDVIRAKLTEFLEALREEIGEINGRSFVDSAPVMERQWAQKAGLGWLGKNSLLLNREMGSFYFLAELIIDLEATLDFPLARHHGDDPHGFLRIVGTVADRISGAGEQVQRLENPLGAARLEPLEQPRGDQHHQHGDGKADHRRKKNRHYRLGRARTFHQAKTDVRDPRAQQAAEQSFAGT